MSLVHHPPLWVRYCGYGRETLVFFSSLEMFRPGISLHTHTSHRLTFDADAYDSVYLYVHDSRGCLRCKVKELMLIPKTVREVERCLLLLETGRGVFVPRVPAVRFAARTFKIIDLPGSLYLYTALSLLTRLQGKGHLGKAIVAHVLNMLGGPMERMESWDPPGSNKRRPCKVRISTNAIPPGNGIIWPDVALGSPENWHATD